MEQEPAPQKRHNPVPQTPSLLPTTNLPTNPGRKTCIGGCDRPINVCLCNKLPPQPIPTTTQIIILQHPNEQRHKLATVPVLQKCLSNCHVVVGRKLRVGSSPVSDSLYFDAQKGVGVPHRAIFLFPGNDSMPSMDINEWKVSSSNSCTNGCVLVVFDGTWKYAKEMVSASLPFLSSFATCVCFNCDFEVSGGSIYDSELILRKEPFKGCMSTMEAIARALRVLEPDGSEIEEKLVDVLRLMVHLQASYLKPAKPRPKLLKKKERKNQVASTVQSEAQWHTETES